VGALELAVAELEAFTQAHPLREYGYELLGLALYRAGRQADALEALRTNQKRLDEELGIAPRPSLQRLHRDILNQEPVLEWPQSLAPYGNGLRCFPASTGRPLAGRPPRAAGRRDKTAARTAAAPAPGAARGTCAPSAVRHHDAGTPAACLPPRCRPEPGGPRADRARQGHAARSRRYPGVSRRQRTPRQWQAGGKQGH
jgi:hypothetical protein